jgi:hypothetical protein
MSPPALDYARFASGRRFLYDDGGQLFVKDPATESGRTSYVTEFSTAADAASDPDRSRIVWQTEFKADPLSLQSGVRTVRPGSFSTDVWVSGGNTVQQLTVSTGNSGAFGSSPIQQLIGRPAGLTIPLAGTWTTERGSFEDCFERICVILASTLNLRPKDKCGVMKVDEIKQTATIAAKLSMLCMIRSGNQNRTRPTLSSLDALPVMPCYKILRSW